MTDELKPCLAYPCDGYMKENNYDASLECTSCQFIVADELEYSALVAGRQAAIDAALESVAQMVEKRANDRFYEHGLTETDTGAGYYTGSAAEFYEARDEEDEDIAAAIRSRIDTNPLAEAQARIAELERELAEARKDAERYRWIQRNAEGFSFETPQWDWTGGVLDQLNEAIDTAMRQEGE